MAPLPRWLRREVFVGLALGQFVSLLITSTGFSSSELARRGVNAPTSQSLLNYILLALVYGGTLIYRRQHLTIKWYYYLLLGIIDVEANYIVVKAYQYTSITSVMLLDCWSIPCVIVLTWFFLKTKYGCRKFIGVGVCVAGLVLVVFSDVHASDRAKGSNPLKGDLLVIGGSMLYAVSNVTEEYFVKKSNRIEVMAMLGVFGAIISGIQISILERQELRSTHWNAGAILPFIGFALAMFLFYSTVPIILKICGATMLNLSLLTSDMWAVLIRIFAYHEKVDWMYFLAFGGTAIGLVIYSYKGAKQIAEERRLVTRRLQRGTAQHNFLMLELMEQPPTRSFHQLHLPQGSRQLSTELSLQWNIYTVVKRAMLAISRIKYSDMRKERVSKLGQAHCIAVACFLVDLIPFFFISMKWKCVFMSAAEYCC